MFVPLFGSFDLTLVEFDSEGSMNTSYAGKYGLSPTDHRRHVRIGLFH